MMRRVVLLSVLFLLLSCSLQEQGSPLTSLATNFATSFVTNGATSFAMQDQDPDQSRAETTVRGELLAAFHSAYTAFLRNKAYPSGRKNIANYDVSFTETPETIVVFFSPRRKPGERPLMGGGTSLGMALRVVVSKADYRVLDMKGFK